MPLTEAQLKRALKKRKNITVDLEHFPETFKLRVKKDFPVHINDVRRLLVLKILRRVVRRSPVDRGFYRASHNVSVNTPDPSEPTKPSGAREGADITATERARAWGALATLADLDTRSDVWMTSNLPYSGVIENGEYPDPPKRGSYVRRGRPGGPGWKVLSKGGFSRQAPKGVYRISISEAVREIKAEGALPG